MVLQFLASSQQQQQQRQQQQQQLTTNASKSKEKKNWIVWLRNCFNWDKKNTKNESSWHPSNNSNSNSSNNNNNNNNNSNNEDILIKIQKRLFKKWIIILDVFFVFLVLLFLFNTKQKISARVPLIKIEWTNGAVNNFEKYLL